MRCQLFSLSLSLSLGVYLSLLLLTDGCNVPNWNSFRLLDPRTFVSGARKFGATVREVELEISSPPRLGYLISGWKLVNVGLAPARLSRHTVGATLGPFCLVQRTAANGSVAGKDTGWTDWVSIIDYCRI